MSLLKCYIHNIYHIEAGFSGLFNGIKYIKIHGLVSTLWNNELENLIFFLIFFEQGFLS